MRRIGEETGVAPSAYDHIEKFAQALPHADLGDVLLAAFGTIRPPADRVRETSPGDTGHDATMFETL